MVEKISLASQETAEFNSDNTADDIYAAIEAFIAVVSRIVVGDQAPLDLWANITTISWASLTTCLA